MALPLLLGCDIVQGFQDAGTALFPQQSTHLATPALRLVEGGYSSVGFAAGKELSVLARPTEGSSLVVMRFANPKPCEIPNVGRYVASRNPNRAEAGIAYFHDDAIIGTLHFADTSCRVFDFEIENAHLPVGETERSVIVWAEGDLLEVEPDRGKRTTLAPAVDRVITRAFSDRTLVRSEGQLEVFGGDWKTHGRFGKDVGSVIKTNSGVLYVDASGLHRLSASADGKTQSKPIAEDVCNLGMRDGTWATFHSPCQEGRLHALHEPTGKLFDLDLDADPAYLKLVPERGSLDPTTDPFWFVYLRNVESSLGTFVVKGPDGVPHELGRRATLDHWSIWGTGEKTYGYALVNVENGVGQYLHWNAQGETRSLASGVLAAANRLVVDWDGANGNLAVVSGDRLRVVAERIPADGFEFTDSSGEWTVVFHDWDGESGRLSRFSGTLDKLSATPPGAAFVAPELAEVAPRVGLYTTASLSKLLPGTVFLADYDTTKGTGRLSYENAELRFNATVDNDVSSYLVTSGYLLYAIPYGRDRGIWLATGK